MYRRRKGGEAIEKGRGLFIPPIQPYLAAAIIYISATSCFHIHKCANTFAHENIAARERVGEGGGRGGGARAKYKCAHTRSDIARIYEYTRAGQHNRRRDWYPLN